MKNIKNKKIPKVQTFSLSVNPKNGTVVIPKLARERLKISSKSRSTLTLKIYDNDTAEIAIPKYTLEDVLYNLPPLKSAKFFTDEQIKDGIEEAAIKRYLKNNL